MEAMADTRQGWAATPAARRGGRPGAIYFSPAKPRWRSMNRRTKRLTYASLACLLLLAFAWYGAFSYRSVCTSCGEEELATDWQIPFTSVTYWQSRSERDTPLSRVVSRYGLAKPGVHTWLFAQGNGNG